jgi:hypothetical protein
LRKDFPNHEIYTIRKKGWNGIKNGQLLKLLIEEHFDALLTFDKNLQHQQNFGKFSIAVFVLSARNNTYSELTKLSVKVLDFLERTPLPTGPIEITLDGN